jgi:hypothetical protein
LFFHVSQGALPFLQVQEAELPVFGKTAQGGESCSEGQVVSEGGEVEAEGKGKGRDKEDGVEGGLQTGAEGKARACGCCWTITVPRFDADQCPCSASEDVGEGQLLGRHQPGRQAGAFSVVGDEGRLSLRVIRLWAQVLMRQIELLNVELQVLIDMEEAMFDARLEAGDEMEEGEVANKELEDFE